MARGLARPLAALLVAATVLACQLAQPSQPAIDMTDPRVTAGAQRTCAELDMSAVRCTLVTLRATKLLDEQRPNHVEISSQTLHEAGGPPPGQSPLPANLGVPVVVVFAMADGSRIGVPVICALDAGSSDPACDPRTQ